MNNNADNVGYKKLLKGTGMFIVTLIAMCWLLTEAEEHDRQLRSTQPIAVPVEVASTLATKPVKHEVLFYYYSPKELQDEFDANEVRITHKLAGNVLILSGEISDIGLSLDRPFIVVSVPGSYSIIKVYFGSNMIDMVSKLNVGDSIRVGSRNVSLNPFGTIHLRDSSILSTTNNE
ncbi:hypothetical protein [Rahnella aceris]|uniref:Uncharacterized protein n=1 Tax=Rahnella sp. (strain Y9602) TaxID=2703885 RepID=A0ABW6CHK6_RAHSY